jgi:hypothetical protein
MDGKPVEGDPHPAAAAGCQPPRFEGELASRLDAEGDERRSAKSADSHYVCDCLVVFFFENA